MDYLGAGDETLLLQKQNTEKNNETVDLLKKNHTHTEGTVGC